MDKKFLKLTNTVYKVLEFFPESDPLKNRAKDRALVIMEHLTLTDETSGWMSFQKEKLKAQVLEDIDILLGYLWIGKSQGWLNSINCLIISNEYERIKKQIEPIKDLELTQKLPGLDLQQAQRPLQESTQDVVAIVLENTGDVKPSVASSFAKAMEDKKALEGKEGASVVGTSDIKEESTHKITERQEKILKFLEKNEKAQVMDLRTVLPDVTKRTIRRDLDELLELGKIVRLGDFNQVFYKLPPKDANRPIEIGEKSELVHHLIN